MTARQIKRFAAYAVKLFPTIAFAFVYQINVIQHDAITCLLYVPTPVSFCYLLYVPVLL